MMSTLQSIFLPSTLPTYRKSHVSSTYSLSLKCRIECFCTEIVPRARCHDRRRAAGRKESCVKSGKRMIGFDNIIAQYTFNNIAKSSQGPTESLAFECRNPSLNHQFCQSSFHSYCYSVNECFLDSSSGHHCAGV